MNFVAPCLLGLEGLLANELRYCGITDVRAENGRVLFSGDERTMARSNICSRMAQRVMILLSEFSATDFDALFEGVKAIDWHRYIGVTDAFPVVGSSVSSRLSSVPACQKIIKKAVVEQLTQHYGVSWFDETGVQMRIRFLLLRDRVSIMLDTSGEPLHKRGYRAASNMAPIRETLAAALVELSRVRSNHTVIDPFCGSGTILIESAMKAMHIMPGVSRRFAFEDFPWMNAAVTDKERERARAGEDRDADFLAYGYDIDEDALILASENARIAGVGEKIKFDRRNITDYTDTLSYATVITNPPYGERMLDIESARDLYRVMGRVFERKPHHSYTIISPDERFEELFGRPADRRRKLYNGMLKCQVYMYYR